MGLEDTSQIKFLWTLAMIQVVLVALLFLLGRYDDGANPIKSNSKSGASHLKYNLDSYPLSTDIFMMLFVGFGYLMTFLKRYGLGAIGFTMIFTATFTELAVVVFGLSKIDNEFVIKIGLIEIVEGGVVAAAFLISFGALLGKVNPLQLLIMGVIETICVILNMFVGYTVLGVNDVGGSIYVHTFGAYFGLSVSFMLRKKKIAQSGENEGTRYTSDITSLLGTVVLWIFWPSFNGILATDDARHRAYVNTYISLIGSTITTFIFSGLLENKKFSLEDIQNSTLAGGVIVGATADMVLQPYGACVAGSFIGIVSTVGFRFITSKVYEKLKIHDTCGVHNLHGIPGVLAGLLSVPVVVLASTESYGPSLYKVFPLSAPVEGSHELKQIQSEFPEIEAGEGRTMAFQALIQLIGLSITLVFAIISGLLSGLLISYQKIIETVPDHLMFDDEMFWNMADHDDAGFVLKKGERRKSRSRSIVPRSEDGSSLPAVVQFAMRTDGLSNAGFLE